MKPVRRPRRRLRAAHRARRTSSTRRSRRGALSDGRAARLPAGERGPHLEQAVLRVRRRALAARRSGERRPRRSRGGAGATPSGGTSTTREVLSMPDKWEYPWYAAWDLAFHCIPLALVDPDFAKQQLTLLVREWYMHPNGQIPAYEWQFGDVNPPVHAWAAYRVYQIERRTTGRADRDVPRVGLPQADAELHLVGEPQGHRGAQRLRGGLPRASTTSASSTAASRCRAAGCSSRPTRRAGWACTASTCSTSRSSSRARTPATRTSRTSSSSTSSLIAHAMNHIAGEDVAPLGRGGRLLLRRACAARRARASRCASGRWWASSPLFAVVDARAGHARALPGVLEARAVVPRRTARSSRSTARSWRCRGGGSGGCSRWCDREQLVRVLSRMLDEERVPLAVRGARRCRGRTREHPYELRIDGQSFRVDYEPAESQTGLFGGNSNWRGPVWMPVNYLVIEALQRLAHYYGDVADGRVPDGLGQAHDALGGRGRAVAAPHRALHGGRRRPPPRARSARRSSSATRTSATTSRSTSTSTATPARASARARRRGGRRSSRSSSSSPASGEARRRRDAETLR